MAAKKKTARKKAAPRKAKKAAAKRVTKKPAAKKKAAPTKTDMVAAICAGLDLESCAGLEKATGQSLATLLSSIK